MAVSDEGRAGQRLAVRRAVPPRRERAAHRHRAPARALRHRPLLGGASPSDGLEDPVKETAMGVTEIFETMAYGPAPESDKPALDWLAAHGHEFGIAVGGRWIKGSGGKLFDVINPATTQRLARGGQAGGARAG